MSKLSLTVKPGFKCLKCLDDIYVDYLHYSKFNGREPSADCGTQDIKTNDACKCGNCALILDEDYLVHLYCDDIDTILYCNVCVETKTTTIQCSSNSFVFQSLHKVSDTPLTFKDKVWEEYKPKPKPKTLKQRLKQRKPKTSKH